MDLRIPLCAGIGKPKDAAGCILKACFEILGDYVPSRLSREDREAVLQRANEHYEKHCQGPGKVTVDMLNSILGRVRPTARPMNTLVACEAVDTCLSFQRDPGGFISRFLNQSAKPGTEEANLVLLGSFGQFNRRRLYVARRAGCPRCGRGYCHASLREGDAHTGTGKPSSGQADYGLQRERSVSVVVDDQLIYCPLMPGLARFKTAQEAEEFLGGLQAASVQVLSHEVGESGIP